MAGLLPALNLVAAPGERRATLDIAREIERRGFAGISVSSQYSNVSQCLGLAFATEHIPFATAIAPIYTAHRRGVRQQRCLFARGVGWPLSVRDRGGPCAGASARMGVTPGRPIADIRAFVAKVRSFEGIGPVAADFSRPLRKRMVALCGGDCRRPCVCQCRTARTSPASLAVLPAQKRGGTNFFIGNRIRTCVCDDETEAKAVLWRTVTNYALMPNYRNYWKEAGYVEEMTAIENALANGHAEEIGRYLPDRWLADIALFGSARKIREGVEAWRDAGICTPVLVPLSADGDTKTAIRDVFAAFAD